jgi:hypothetical protein
MRLPVAACIMVVQDDESLDEATIDGGVGQWCEAEPSREGNNGERRQGWTCAAFRRRERGVEDMLLDMWALQITSMSKSEGGMP